MAEVDERRSEDLNAQRAAALGCIPSAVALLDATGRPLWVNQPMQRLLGGSDAPAIAQAIVVPDEADDPLRRALRTAVEDGGATRLSSIRLHGAAGPVDREAWIGPLPTTAGEAPPAVVLVVPPDEERLHPLLANTYDVISVLDADGTIRYSNPAAGRLTGYEGEVLGGTSAIDLVHPDEQDIVLAALSDLPASGDDPLRLRLRFGDGRWHHCLVHIANLLDDPAVGGLVVTVHDITEQVEANDELRRSEQWMRRLLAQLTDVVVVFSEDGEITYVSPSIEALVGQPESVHPGTDAFETIHPDDLGVVDDVLARVLREPESEQRGTVRLRHALGHYVWVEAVVTNGLGDPAVRGIIATLRDVTELKQAEQMFRGLVDSAPDAMVVVDDAGTLVLVNERAEQLFGWSADELVGQSVDVLVPDAVRERHEAHRRDFVASPRTRAMGEGLELMARRRDGSEVPVEVSLAPHETHRGRLVSAAIRDITAQRETRRALESALHGEQDVVRRLEKADALRAEFVSTVAHELKSPLTAISGFAQMLQRVLGEDDGSPASPGHMASRIRVNSDRMLDMIEQLLRFSRLEAGSARLEREEVDLRTVVDRSIELLGEALSGHDLQVDIPDGLTVWADPDGLANVVRNLLSNAGKFGPKATRIWVDAEQTPDGVQVSVSDEGPGVPPGEREQVFEQFHQTETGRRRGGTGIGLSIARRYVELHDGDIWVDQRPGAGARFSFFLPGSEP